VPKKEVFKGQKEFEKRATEMTNRIAEELDLGWLRINHRFNEHAAPESLDTIAEAYPHWEYRQTKIIWNVSTASTVNDDELERVIIHELVHALIAPLFEELSNAQQQKLSKQNELSTENITRAITAARSHK
jgi:hypothetical protein